MMKLTKELAEHREVIANHQQDIYGDVHKKSPHAVVRKSMAKLYRHRW